MRKRKKHAIFAPSTISVDSDEFADNTNDLLLRFFDFSEPTFRLFSMHSRVDLEKSREASFAAMAILRWFYNVFWTSVLRQPWH